MWQYQWTNVQNELTDELKDTLYEESQGIVDIAVKLYMLAQIEVIGKTDSQGKPIAEIITQKTIRKVAKRDLHLVQKYISALKSGNPDAIALMDDIQPIDIKEMIDNKANSVKDREKINAYKKEVRKKNQELAKDVWVTLTQNLIALSIQAKVAEKAAREAIDEMGGKTDLPALMKRAGEIAYSGAASSQKATSKTKKSKKKPYSEECKLLNLVIQARKEKTSVYNKIQENGYIKHPLYEHFLLEEL
jgi:hypothetical protein